MKKILYIHHGKGLGGAGLSLLHMVRALDKTQYYPIVLFLCADQGLIDLYRSYNIETIGPIHQRDLPHTVMLWFRWHQVKFLLKSLSSSIKTWWSIADYWYGLVKPDIVHVNTSSLTMWMHRASRRGIPVICHIREPLAPGYFGLRRWLLQKAISRWATKIVTISKNEALPWSSLEKTNVVYNAVDPELFRYASKIAGTECPKVLFLGGLASEKGTLTILKAFQKMREKEPYLAASRLVIAGYFQPYYYPRWHPRYFSSEQQYIFDVQSLVERLGDAVEVVGSRSDVPALMNECDVVVFPAAVGHFARPIIEAGFMKKPVIGSALPPLNELVVDGKTGFLIPPQDIEQWACKLAVILKDAPLRQRMGESAYVFCRDNFLLSDQIRKIECLYQYKESNNAR